MKRILIVIAAMTASCTAPSVSVMPFVASSSLDGSVASSGGGITASTDLGSLGVGDAEVGFGGRVDLVGPSSQWSITHGSSSFDGSGLLDASLDLGGFEFEAALPATMSMDMGVTSLLWTKNFGIGDTAHFGIGFGLSALGIAAKIEGEVDDDGIPGGSTTTETGSMDETLPIPLLGLRLGGDIGPVRVEATYAFLEVDVDEGSVSVTDMDIYGGLDVLGDIGTLVIGYREFAFDASFADASDSADMDLQLGGPYLGVRFAF
jgi:hypothetical protein